MKSRKILALVIAVLFVVSMLPGATIAAGPKFGGNLNVGMQGEIDLLNPLLTSSQTSLDVMSAFYEPLIQVSDKLEFVPILATAVPTVKNGGISKDGLTWTVHLKKNVKWHDGKPFTAADWKFTWQKAMDPKTNIVTTEGWAEIKSVSTPDPYTLVIKLNKTYAPFITVLASMVLPKHIFEKSVDFNKDPRNFDHIVGTGPYVFEKWVKNQYVIVHKNAAYYKPVYLNKIIFKLIPNETTLLTQLKTGEIDYFYQASAAFYKELKAMKGVNVYTTPQFTWEHININNSRPLLKDKTVRTALYMCIDRQKLSDVVYNGLYIPAYSDQAAISPYMNKNLKNMAPKFNPVAAGALLDKAGWKKGADGIRSKNGTRLSVTISTTAGRIEREQTEVLYKAWCKQAGIEIVIKNYGRDIFFASAKQGGIIDNGKYDLAIFAWSTSVDPNDRTLWSSTQLPPNGQNNAFYVNKSLDKLLDAGVSTVDAAARKKIYDQVQEILLKDVAVIPTLYWAQIDVAKSDFKGLKPNPSQAGCMWNISEWWLDR